MTFPPETEAAAKAMCKYLEETKISELPSVGWIVEDSRTGRVLFNHLQWSACKDWRDNQAFVAGLRAVPVSDELVETIRNAPCSDDQRLAEAEFTAAINYLSGTAK